MARKVSGIVGTAHSIPAAPYFPICLASQNSWALASLARASSTFVRLARGSLHRSISASACPTSALRLGSQAYELEQRRPRSCKEAKEIQRSGVIVGPIDGRNGQVRGPPPQVTINKLSTRPLPSAPPVCSSRTLVGRRVPTGTETTEAASVSSSCPFRSPYDGTVTRIGDLIRSRRCNTTSQCVCR